MKNRETKRAWEEAAISAAAREGKIEAGQVLEELAPLLTDYFVLRSLRQTEKGLEMAFYNGHTATLSLKIS